MEHQSQGKMVSDRNSIRRLCPGYSEPGNHHSGVHNLFGRGSIFFISFYRKSKNCHLPWFPLYIAGSRQQHNLSWPYYFDFHHILLAKKESKAHENIFFMITSPFLNYIALISTIQYMVFHRPLLT